MDPAALQLQGVSLRYSAGTTAVSGLDLSVHEGTFVSIVGPSGCGKSTALRLIAGLERPTDGVVRLFTDSTAFVFQEANLLPWRTVEANVGLPLELQGVSAAGRRESVLAAIAQVGLSGFEKHFPRELSGGMRMRVSLARALVMRPRVLLLDEPFGALDEMTRQTLQEDLVRLQMSERWTVLFVTHSVYEAVYLSDRVVVMSSRPGRVLGEVEIPFPRPRNAEVRERPEFALAVGAVGRRLRENSP